MGAVATGTIPSPRRSTFGSRLTSLAILKANWDEANSSFLDMFVPFITEVLRLAGQPLSADDVKDLLRRRFGIRMPSATVKSLLDRAVRDDKAERDGAGWRTVASATTSAVARREREIIRCYEALVAGLIQFAGSRFSRDVSLAEASAVLDRYVDDHGASILVRGSAAELPFGPSAVGERDMDYIVHAFVEQLDRSDPSLFRYLETVVEGSMLASVVWLPDTGAVSRRFRDSTIYLDTEFLLYLLGLAGPVLQGPAEELVQHLKEYGGRVACFDRTLSELRGVIQSKIGKLSNPTGPRDIAGFLAAEGWTRSDLEIYAAELERKLRGAGVDVLPSPPHVIDLTRDESEIEAVLQERVGYHRDGTRRHDLDNLTSIERIRMGRPQPILEDSRAILVTPNDRLVRAAAEAFLTDPDMFTWPLVITDEALATLIWLKQPGRYPDLPRKRILADCYAHLQPQPELWAKCLQEVERLHERGAVSDQDVDIMRFHPEARRILMDRTLGDPSSVTTASVTEVIASATALVQEPLSRELDAMRAQISMLQRDLTDERTARARAEEDAARRATAHKRAEKEAARRLERQRGQIQVVAHQRGNRDSWILTGLTVILVVGSALLTRFGVEVGDVNSAWIAAPVGVVLAFGLVLQVLSATAGMKIESVRPWVADRLANRYEHRALRRAGL